MSRSVLQRATANAAVAHLRLARGAGKYVIWVEGPDDCVVLERFAAPRCTVKELSGRQVVMKAVQDAVRANPPIDGFFGLIDRDFDDLQAESLPSRIVPISRRFTDLESAMLAIAGEELLKDFVRRDQRSDIAWLHQPDGGGPLELLAQTVTAPIGAMRANWDGRNGSIEDRIHPVDQLLRVIRVGERPSRELMATLLAARIEQREADKLAAAAHRKFLHADAWRLTRGKDMVRAIAVVLTRHPEACYYGSDDVRLLERRIHERIITLFDHEVLESAGTVDEILRVLTPLDESLSNYLVPRRSS